MKLARLFPGLLLLWLGFLSAATAQEQGVWEIKGLTPESEIEIDSKTDFVTATLGVHIKYSDPLKQREAILTATRVTLNKDTGEVVAEGMVNLQSAGQIWRGDRLQYNFKSGKIEADNFRTGKAPFFAAGTGLTADLTNQTYTAANAFLTGDDTAEPNYRIRAKSIKIVPGQLFEAHQATFYLGSVPVLYFPYYHRSLTRHPNNFEFTPGYRSLYGPYLLGTYNWFWSTNLSGSLHLDYRQKRGVGYGPDFTYDLGKFGEGTLQFYYLHDEAPGNDPAGKPIRDYRHRISFFHQMYLRTNLSAKVVVREQSDAQLTRDFFEHEYRRNTQPNSFLEVNQLWPNVSLNVFTQPQINDFFETVERLPDVKLTAVRQQLGVSPIYYESESSIGYFRHQFANPASNSFAAFRGDTYHQLILPKTFFGWLNVTPRAGGRFTHYGETEGLNSTLTEQHRAVFNTGAEVSFKASRTWAGTRSSFWEVNELRHIVQPSINYVYVPSPNKLPPQLPQFDSELPTLRLLPIEYPDYNAIDSIDSQNVLRFSLRNKLQTKRRDGVDNVVNWALYTDWRLRPRLGQSTFADVFSDLDFKPRSWLTFNSEVRYDVANNRWREANHTATILPGNTWSWTVGHRYLRDDFAFYGQGNNLIVSRLYYRLNENWAARFTHHFEARDGTMEEQYYTIYRDLRSWTAALTFRVRDNRAGPLDYTVAVTFSLKAFPRFKLGSDSDRPSLLLGS